MPRELTPKELLDAVKQRVEEIYDEEIASRPMFRSLELAVVQSFGRIGRITLEELHDREETAGEEGKDQ